MELKDCIDVIRNESLDNLLNQDYLENLLPKFGIDPSLRNHKMLPEHLIPYCDKNIGFAQYPNQFSKYLIFLSDKNIKSYFEIGVKFGGSFILTVEYLSRFNPIEEAVCLDLRPISDNLKEYKKHKNIEYICLNSQDSKAISTIGNKVFDLCLIDGDHSYDGCNGDYKIYKKNAKYIAFHDIVMMEGVVRTWNEAKEESSASHEFVDQYDIPSVTYENIKYDNMLGLGVVKV